MADAGDRVAEREREMDGVAVRVGEYDVELVRLADSDFEADNELDGVTDIESDGRVVIPVTAMTASAALSCAYVYDMTRRSLAVNAM